MTADIEQLTKMVCDAAQDGRGRVFWIQGEWGVGKTALLSSLAHIPLPGTVKAYYDFYHIWNESLTLTRFLGILIAELGPDHFSGYLESAKESPRDWKLSVDWEIDAFEAFCDDWHLLAESTSAWLLFDSFDQVAGSMFERWFVKVLLPCVSGAIVVVAGSKSPRYELEDCEFIRLTGFTAAQSKQFLESELGRPVPDSWAALLQTLTGGNPRKLALVASALAETDLELAGSDVTQRRLQAFFDDHTGQLSPQVVEVRGLDNHYWAQVLRASSSRASRRAGITTETIHLVVADDRSGRVLSSELTPEYLAGIVGPYLIALGEVQHLLDEIEERPPNRIRIRSITQSSPISVSLEGAAEAVEVVKDTVVKWRREHARTRAELEEKQAQGDIEVRKAEVAERQANAEKTEAEAEKLKGEAAVQRATAAKMAVETEQLRLQLYREQMQLALDLLKQIAPNLTEIERAMYLQRLLPALSTLTLSELEVITDCDQDRG